jgi:ribosomal protein S2
MRSIELIVKILADSIAQGRIQQQVQQAQAQRAEMAEAKA